MKTVLNVIGKSQFELDIHERFRPSACGPVTAYVILNYHLPNQLLYEVNELYRFLGSTKIGLFTWRFIRNMKKILGKGWTVERCTAKEVIHEIDNGRPVAAKFDKWFTFNWHGKFAFDYHWVPVVGYEKSSGDLFLIVHDNGGRNRASQLRKISYGKNKSILTFVKIKKDTI